MNPIKYIKKNGIRHTVEVIYTYKLEAVLEKLMLIMTRNIELKDTIMIESHNDFDCNGGAFYNYLIKNGYNERYKIVWLVRKKVMDKLPANVETVPLYGPNIKKAYYVCTSKYFTFDCENVQKMRKGQVMVCCGHGAGGFKNVKGKLMIPKCVDYILVQSKSYAPIQANQWSIESSDKRLISIGYPAQDIFFDGSESNELQKLTSQKYKKVILWMPTFRKGGGYHRNDSRKEQKLGIPLIETQEQYLKLNNCLAENNVFLIIKIHPKQDLENLKIKDQSNVKVLTGETVKELKIDNYAMMKCADALISDYSGAAYEYLQLDRPIGYVLDDMNDYIAGFVVKDIHTLIAGTEIYNFEQLASFIVDVVSEKDSFKERRKKIRDYIYEYHDANSSKRLAEIMGIKNNSRVCQGRND